MIDAEQSSGGLGGGIGFPGLEGRLGTATELSGTFIGSPTAISSMNLRPAGLQPGTGRVEHNSLTWGLGLTYRLSANLRVRTEWERLDDGLNLFGAGLQFNWNLVHWTISSWNCLDAVSGLLRPSSGLSDRTVPHRPRWYLRFPFTAEESKISGRLR